MIPDPDKQSRKITGITCTSKHKNPLYKIMFKIANIARHTDDWPDNSPFPTVSESHKYKSAEEIIDELSGGRISGVVPDEHKKYYNDIESLRRIRTMYARTIKELCVTLKNWFIRQDLLDTSMLTVDKAENERKIVIPKYK